MIKATVRTGKRPRDIPEKRERSMVKEDTKLLGLTNLKERMRDRKMR